MPEEYCTKQTNITTYLKIIKTVNIQKRNQDANEESLTNETE